MGSIPRDTFSEEERQILRRYFTNVDGPVTAILHLPEVVVAALCARTARSHQSIRRLFLDEFLPDLDTSEDAHLDATEGHGTPNHWYQEVFDQLGGSGARQFAPLHLHVEGISLLAAKALERGRLMSYLEGSTRSQPYDERLPSGQYRYLRPVDVLDSPLGTRYVGDLDRTFDAYRELKSLLQSWIEPRLRPDLDDVTNKRVSAQQSLDAARGLLPVATLNTVSLFGNAMSYAQLLARLESSELQELRSLAPVVRMELERVFPQSLFRLPDDAASYRETNHVVMREVEKTLRPRLTSLPTLTNASPQHSAQGLEVTLVDFDPKGEDRVLAAMLYETSDEPFAVMEDRVRALDPDQRREVFSAYVGNRSHRDLRPGRAFEHTEYHFEIVGDYGSYRDLQRHRMLTPLRQRLSGDLGFVLPSLVDQAGGTSLFVATVQRTVSLWEALMEQLPECAPYALTLSNRIRYSLRLNAREALHVLELRSNQPGHEAYRGIAQSMHRAIAEQAGHRNIAEAMRYVNHDDPGNVYNSGSSLRERFMDGEEEARRKDR